MEKKVTIYDIAAKTGFSAVTVHRALGGKGRISAQTKNRILKAAQELGYKANPAAQGLRRAPIKLGAVLFCPVEEYVDAIVDGIAAAGEALEKYNVSTDIHKLPYTDTKTCLAAACDRIDALVADGCRGILLFISAWVDELADLAACVARHTANGIQFATVANDIPLADKVFHVGVNAFMAGRMAAELLSFSCRNKAVALLVASTDSPVNREYIDGFESYANGVFARVSIHEHFDDKTKIEPITRQMLTDDPDLCGVYMTTASSAKACRFVGDRDLTIITTDLLSETPALLQNGVANATVFQNPYKQGKTALRTLYDSLTKGNVPPISRITPHILLSSNLESYLFAKEERYYASDSSREYLP